MPLPTPASVPDLATSMPTVFAVALGVWFATTTAILIAETRLVHRIAKFRFYNIWRVLPVVHVLAARSHWRNSL
jgi:hypothetical protein